MTGRTNDQVVPRQGDFIWYELMTNDTEAAQAFYGGLLGWSFENAGNGGMDYHLFAADGPNVGGFLPLTPEMTENGARPLWAGYMLVFDVDKTVTAIVDEDGMLLMGPLDIPDVGRIAFVADPQGAPFYVMNPIPPKGVEPGPSQAFAAYMPTEGHCAWNELVAADPEAAKRWYGKLFGFTQINSLDMGPMGEYRIMQNAGQDFAYGGLMQKPEQMPESLWTYYFRVHDIDVAVKYIGANGAQVINGPNEIPGGDFVLNGIDPQGAAFALIGKRY